MVAGHDRFDDSSNARCVEAGEKHCRLDLRGGHRHAVGDRVRGLRAMQRHRQAVAFGRRDLHAHFAQRIEHAAHRAFGKRCITDEGGGEVIDANQTHGETATGAGIAEIERRFGCQKRAIAGTLDDPLSTDLFDLGAHGAHRLAGIDDVFTFQKASDASFARSEAAEHEGAV
ncbi:hypothetical protein D3C73_1075740 [compost metagenome]